MTYAYEILLPSTTQIKSVAQTLKMLLCYEQKTLTDDGFYNFLPIFEKPWMTTIKVWDGHRAHYFLYNFEAGANDHRSLALGENYLRTIKQLKEVYPLIMVRGYDKEEE